MHKIAFVRYARASNLHMPPRVNPRIDFRAENIYTDARWNLVTGLYNMIETENLIEVSVIFFEEIIKNGNERTLKYVSKFALTMYTAARALLNKHLKPEINNGNAVKFLDTAVRCEDIEFLSLCIPHLPDYMGFGMDFIRSLCQGRDDIFSLVVSEPKLRNALLSVYSSCNIFQYANTAKLKIWLQYNALDRLTFSPTRAALDNNNFESALFLAPLENPPQIVLIALLRKAVQRESIEDVKECLKLRYERETIEDVLNYTSSYKEIDAYLRTLL